MVQKRYVFHAPGFDPYDVASQHRRFLREASRFATTWNVTANVSALRQPPDDRGHWTVTTTAPGWQVEACYELLDWHDIVRGELARPGIARLWHGAVTYWDFIASGTLARYFKANWRYAMFFLVPCLIVILFMSTALAIGGVVAGLAAPVLRSGVLGAAAGALVAVLAFAALMRWPGQRWRVSQGLADWVFAREYMLGRHSDMNARLDAFAGRLVACARRADTDEIIIAGHSLGATVVIDVVTRALERDPDLGRHGPQLNILTIGATIPKLALHPAGAWLREQSRRVATEPSLAWAEYQARDDIISFHKFDPVRLVRSKDVDDDTGLTIRRVQIHEMLDAATFRRFRFHYMRLHYQFVMANERRALYDYFMLVCGPVWFRRIVRQPNGPDDLFAADGSLRDVVQVGRSVMIPGPR